MKQLILKYKGYSWSTGTQYTASCPDYGDIAISSPMLLPASWTFDGCEYNLKSGSNTSSQLYSNRRDRIGEIHQSCRHWDVVYDLVRYQVVQLKRGYVLKSSIGMIATIKTNNIGRVICTYNEDKHVPLALLLYLTIYYRISFDSGSG